MRARPRVGVSALLLATLASFGANRPASAAVILRDVNVTLTATNVESYDLDVDRNGTTDFTFDAALVLDPVLSVGFNQVRFPFASDNGVLVDTRTLDGFPTASLLRLGDTVSAANTFSLSSDFGNLFSFISIDTPPTTGNFGGRSGYVGLRFAGAGGTLFGFAQITVNDLDAANNPLGLTIGTVGFETAPGQPVRIAAHTTAVPEPATLLVAGAGLALLAARRPRRRGLRCGPLT